MILVEPRFGFSAAAPNIPFSQALVFNIEAMVRDEAINTAAELFEAVMRFAREHDWSANVNDLSNKEGLGLLGDAAATTILDLMPKAARGILKKGLHYRVQNLSK